MSIGVCGIGRMGAALVERLIEQGNEVVVWNRTTANCEPMQALGAEIAASPADLAAKCDTTLVILTDEVAQNAVYSGTNGFSSIDLDGRLIIDMSTVPPAASQRAAQAVTFAGGAFLECPVGGSVAPAKAGKLLGLVGGNDEDFARAKPILDQVCRRIEHVGAVGAGAAMKLAVNLPLAVYWEALGEALAIATSSGISKDLAADILSDTSGTIPVMKPRLEAILSAIDDSGHAPPAFDIACMIKDLGLMEAAAGELGVEAPVVSAARGAYEQAGREGWSERDAATQAAWRVRSKG